MIFHSLINQSVKQIRTFPENFLSTLRNRPLWSLVLGVYAAWPSDILSGIIVIKVGDFDLHCAPFCTALCLFQYTAHLRILVEFKDVATCYLYQNEEWLILNKKSISSLNVFCTLIAPLLHYPPPPLPSPPPRFEFMKKSAYVAHLFEYLNFACCLGG